MKSNHSFLTPEERDEFKKPDRYSRRSIVELSLETGSVDLRQAQQLTGYIVGQLETLIRRGAKWAECFCISVKPDDGMSWSAEAVKEALARSLPQFHKWCLSNRTRTGLPAIADVLGRGKFLSLVRRSHLVSAAPRRWSWRNILAILSLIGLALLVVAIGIVLKTIFENSPSLIQTIKNPRFWLFVLCEVGVAWIMHALSGRLLPHQAPSDDSVGNELDEKQGTEEHEEFIEALADKLRTADFPRIVIVDNYERLDFTTKATVKRYMQKFWTNGWGAECWIVFEVDGEGEKLSNLLLSRNAGFLRIFEQLWLTEGEKLAIARRLGRSDSAADFASVKSVCHDRAEGEARIRNFLLEFRKTHPKDPQKYGILELLFLLSLTAAPGNEPLGLEMLVSELSTKERSHNEPPALRPRVLSKTLYGTNFTKLEFRNHLNDLVKGFESFLTLETVNAKPTLRVNPEVKSVLTTTADELQLPDEEFGHLFWALFWYDRLRSKTPNASGLRKLAYHVLESDPTLLLDEVTSPNAARELFKIHLYLVDSCLRVCLFSQLPRLLENAFALLETDELRNSAPDLRRLFRSCWAAFSVLGHDDILLTELRLFSMHKTKMRLSENGEESLLEEFFVDSMPVAPTFDVGLTGDFFTWVREEKQAGVSVSQYARARSSWLALTILPALERLRSERLLKLCSQADLWLEQTIAYTSRNSDELRARTSEVPEGNLRLIDFIAFSLTLWCHALSTNQGFLTAVAPLSQGSNGGHGSDELDGIFLYPQKFGLRFLRLIEACESAVLLASLMRQDGPRGSDGGIGIDYVMNGLAREICTVSLVSLLTAYRLLSEQSIKIADEKVLERINGIFDVSSEALGYRLPNIARFDDLLRQDVADTVDRLLKLCGIMWHKFGLERLRDLINLRRIQFATLSMNLNPDVLEEVLESVSSSINERDSLGLLTNSVVSNCLSEASELAGHYVAQAARIALQPEFGRGLSHQLCLAAVVRNHVFHGDLSIFLDDLADQASTSTSFLSDFFRKLPKQQLITCVNIFMNALKHSPREETRKRVREILQEFIEKMSPGKARDEVHSLMEVFSVGEMLEGGQSLDFHGLVANWSSRKESWLYPWVLDTVLEHSDPGPILRKEAEHLLVRDPSSDNWNTYLFLALTLAEQTRRSDASDPSNLPAVSYLKGSMNRWEKELSVEQNLRIYGTLYDLDDKNRGTYLPKIKNWQEKGLYRDHIKRFPELAAQGRFFMLFEEYFRAMRFWGLSSDVPIDHLLGNLRVDSDTKRKSIQHWEASGRQVPDPIVGQKQSRSVSSEFLVLGSYLFSAPIDGDSSFDQDRHRFDKAAGSWLHILLEVIIDLPKIPASIRNLLQNFSQSLLDRVAALD